MTHYADNLKKSIVTTQGRITQMIHDDNEQTNAAYREAIIRMAQEAYGDWYPNAVPPELERFAALVAAAEREACELTVDSLIISGPVSEVQQRHNWAYMYARDAIRARNEQEQPR